MPAHRVRAEGSARASCRQNGMGGPQSSSCWRVLAENPVRSLRRGAPRGAGRPCVRGGNARFRRVSGRHMATRRPAIILAAWRCVALVSSDPTPSDPTLSDQALSDPAAMVRRPRTVSVTACVAPVPVRHGGSGAWWWIVFGGSRRLMGRRVAGSQGRRVAGSQGRRVAGGADTALSRGQISCMARASRLR